MIAPAGVIQEAALARGVSLLKALGYVIRLADGIFTAQGYLAGSVEHRIGQIHTMFRDDRVDAVMCARGGFGCLHLLPHIDYDIIRDHPKPFIGFSDITALHYTFFSKAGLVTFHGPMASTIGTSDDRTRLSWQQTLSGEHGEGVLHDQVRIVQPGMAEGVITGGNLSTLCHLLGTPFSPSFSGCIVLIEEVNEAPYRIDRMLTQMVMAGCFDGVCGVLLGNFTGCGPDSEILAVIGKVFENIRAPIVAGLPVGHGQRNLTVPLGVRARLDADRKAFVLLESPFSKESTNHGK